MVRLLKILIFALLMNKADSIAVNTDIKVFVKSLTLRL